MLEQKNSTWKVFAKDLVEQLSNLKQDTLYKYKKTHLKTHAQNIVRTSTQASY